jgi:hypothetical protein
MNEIDLLARLRDEVPGDQVSARAERRLADAIASPAPRRAPARRGGSRAWQARPSRPRWRLATAGLAVAAVAAGTAAALVAGTGSAPPARLTAEELAYRAAASAARSPDVRPGQWVYRELYARPKTPFQASGITRQWATANNQTNAFYLHGRLIVGPWSTWQPLGCVSHTKPFRPVPCAPGRQRYLKFRVATPFVRYSQLSSLPTSPRRLIPVLAARNPHGFLYNMALQPGSMVDEQPGRAHTEHEYVGSPALRAFSVISNLLSTYVMPPRLTAELYRALGDLHGVEVYRNVTDVTGRHGIAFYMPFRPHARTGEDIIVNPRTYQLMGFGNRQDGTAVLYQAIVAGPGVRPGRH